MPTGVSLGLTAEEPPEQPATASAAIVAARIATNAMGLPSRGKFGGTPGSIRAVAVAFGPPVVMVTVNGAGCPAVTFTVAGLAEQVSVSFASCTGQASVTTPLKVLSGVICKLKTPELPGTTFTEVDELDAAVTSKSSPVPETCAVCGLEGSASTT